MTTIRRIICEHGRGGAGRCRLTATMLVIYPRAPGGHYRCEEHAKRLAALITERGDGPVRLEEVSSHDPQA